MGENYPDQNQREIPSPGEMRTPSETGNAGERPTLSPPPDVGRGNLQPMQEKSPSSQEAPDSATSKQIEKVLKLVKFAPEGGSSTVRDIHGNEYIVDRTVPGETRIVNVKTGQIDQVIKFEKEEATGSKSTGLKQQFAGVPGGRKTDSFGHMRPGPKLHLGIDASPSKRGDGSVNDPRRGSPVYAVLKPTIDIKDLNKVQAFDRNRQPMTGLGIPGQGTATLERAVVITKPWQPKSNDSKGYGDVLGLACRYSYTKNDGSPGHFTLNIQYAHLITKDYLPWIDSKGKPISEETWRATGKGIGFGDQMKNGAILSKDQLSGATPPLVGYLGATLFPHVHIQAIYKVSQDNDFPRIDPSVMLDNNRSLHVK